MGGIKILAGARSIGHLVAKACIKARDLFVWLLCTERDLVNFHEQGMG